LRLWSLGLRPGRHIGVAAFATPAAAWTERVQNLLLVRVKHRLDLIPRILDHRARFCLRLLADRLDLGLRLGHDWVNLRPLVRRQA
jgi:hypothetical protein